MKQEPVNVKLPEVYHDMICDICREYISLYNEKNGKLGARSSLTYHASERIKERILRYSDTYKATRDDIYYLQDAISSLVSNEILEDEYCQELSTFLDNAYYR